jgi:uncharacterized protein YxeA
MACVATASIGQHRDNASYNAKLVQIQSDISMINTQQKSVQETIENYELSETSILDTGNSETLHPEMSPAISAPRDKYVLKPTDVMPQLRTALGHARSADGSIQELKRHGYNTAGQEKELMVSIGHLQREIAESMEIIRDGASQGLNDTADNLAVIQRKYDQ